MREQYQKGICEFPGGASSTAAERLAEELARIAIERATAEICEQLSYRRAA